uniref:Tyrosine-protein kinase n=1 Tax=Parascaris univalens TaxID=6257 RepID=A0A915AKQ9_PARUN
MNDNSLPKDDFVRVTSPTSDQAWYRSRGMQGIESLLNAGYIRSSSSDSVPSSLSSGRKYVDNNEQPMPWFHGNISREHTERLLAEKADGTFLVRESTNFPGDFTLCMAYKGKVEHYRIYQTNGVLTCDHEESFENLTQLISHYKRDADGLCHRLVTPIIAEKYRLGPGSVNIDDRARVFKQASLVIRRAEIKLGDTIGHGEFGDVLFGSYNGRRVAVKVLKRNAMVQSLLDEAKFMIGLEHPNLVALVGVVLDDARDLYMVTEYMANGNLVDFLRSRGRHQVERTQLTQFAIDICEGMRYLEARNVVHRDLAARNVLLDDVLTAKISDFGLAKDANDCHLVESSAGKFPIKWTAPEALRYSKFSTKSDMWSFGVLLWEIFSFGRVPYPRIPIQDVVRHIERGYRMEPPEGCPTEISRLMNEAWMLDPNSRPTFSHMLQRLKALQAVGFPPVANSS